MDTQCSIDVGSGRFEFAAPLTAAAFVAVLGDPAALPLWACSQSHAERAPLFAVTPGVYDVALSQPHASTRPLETPAGQIAGAEAAEGDVGEGLRHIARLAFVPVDERLNEMVEAHYAQVRPRVRKLYPRRP